MNLYEQLELVDVVNDPDRVTLTYLDTERNEIHNVVWRKQKFDQATKKYVDDAEKLEQCKQWSKQYFDVELDDIESVVGRKDDIYAYDTFDSLWECDRRFTLEDVGEIITTTFKSIDLEKDRIAMRFEYDGNTYCANKKFTQLYDGKQIVNPQKRARQIRSFEDDFGVPIEEKDKLVGHEIKVEVKRMGNFAYAEVKAFPKKKK